MKKLISIFISLCLFTCFYAESNAHDTQAVIVNSLLIQQMMNNMNQQNQNQNQNSNQDNGEKSKKKRIEDEDDLMDLGYKRFRLGEAEDNFVFKNSKNREFEIDLWAVGKRGNLSYYGSILVSGKRGYKGNPLDDDLDEYRCVWMKILNDDNAIIKALGEKHDDQYFEIQ